MSKKKENHWRTFLHLAYFDQKIFVHKSTKKIGLFVLQAIQIIVSVCAAFVPLHVIINTRFA